MSISWKAKTRGKNRKNRQIIWRSYLLLSRLTSFNRNPYTTTHKQEEKNVSCFETLTLRRHLIKNILSSFQLLVVVIVGNGSVVAMFILKSEKGAKNNFDM